MLGHAAGRARKDHQAVNAKLAPSGHNQFAGKLADCIWELVAGASILTQAPDALDERLLASPSESAAAVSSWSCGADQSQVCINGMDH